MLRFRSAPSLFSILVLLSFTASGCGNQANDDGAQESPVVATSEVADGQDLKQEPKAESASPSTSASPNTDTAPPMLLPDDVASGSSTEEGSEISESEGAKEMAEGEETAAGAITSTMTPMYLVSLVTMLAVIVLSTFLLELDA